MENTPDRPEVIRTYVKRVDSESVWHECQDIFVGSPRFAALSPEEQVDAEWIIERFGFGVWQRNYGPPAELELETVQWCLLHFLPRELDDIEDAEDVPGVVIAFLRMLEDERVLPAAGEMVEWIEQNRDAIIEACDNPPVREEDLLSYDDEITMPIVNDGPKVGRNDPCPCGSGKKYKKCCG